jgi:hypothetical protein
MPSVDEPNREVIRSENLSVVLFSEENRNAVQKYQLANNDNEHFYHQNVMAPVVIPSLMKSHVFYITSSRVS